MYTTYYASSSLISFLSLLSIMCVYTTAAAAACRSSSKQTKMKLVTIKLLTLEFYRWLVFMGFIDDFYLVSLLYCFSFLLFYLFVCSFVCSFFLGMHVSSPAKDSVIHSACFVHIRSTKGIAWKLTIYLYNVHTLSSY